MKMIIIGIAITSLLGPSVPASPLPESSEENLMTGKTDGGRSIHLELVVQATPEKLFRLWTTEEGVQSFFAPRANIELREGGRYEMIFAPDIDPEGENQGTRGARILRLEKNRALAFEWITFVYERHPSGFGPPVVSREERDERPIPTWVEIELEEVEGHPGQTRLRLVHRGFRSGAAWDEALPYFWKQWGAILGRLGAVLSTTD